MDEFFAQLRAYQNLSARTSAVAEKWLKARAQHEPAEVTEPLRLEAVALSEQGTVLLERVKAAAEAI